MDLKEIGYQAKEAFEHISRTSLKKRREAVLSVADQLEFNQEDILNANIKDVQLGRATGLTEALIDRLTININRLNSIINDMRTLADLPDAIGKVSDKRDLPNGLKIHRQSVPLGVLGVIYESRPNVTTEVATLAIKTGNTVILRGGKETLHTNRILVQLVQTALRSCDLSKNCVQFIDDPDRALVGEMLRLNDFIDVIIPRGGEGLHAFCRQNATIPVITGGIGICHLYTDSTADLDKSIPVIHNAKTQRPSVCNSLDTLLVHEDIAAKFLPRIVEELSKTGVTFRADEKAFSLVNHSSVFLAGENDFDTEWLSLILGLKVVPSLDEAINHIHEHSTHHSDGILTQNPELAERFVREIDSAVVYVNASTRFTDGSQMGLGAEVAVSTQRLHARGPMGLPELTSYKWVISGDYTVRK